MTFTIEKMANPIITASIPNFIMWSTFYTNLLVLV
ncbi:Uncharacterised protein [Streptococcus porcinus]|nr:Uncharacterised protein [Streptococcus porcinus]